MSFVSKILLPLLLLFIIQIYFYTQIIPSFYSPRSSTATENETLLHLVQKESKQNHRGEKIVQRQAAAATTSLLVPVVSSTLSTPQNPPTLHRRTPPIMSGGNSRAEFRGYNFALIICQHPITKKFLAVHETNNRGWWIPGGGVNVGESFREAAIREAMEEAGVEIQLKGVLKIEHNLLSTSSRKSHHDLDHGSFFRMRVIFYAEPKDLNNCQPKSVADDESLEAEWLTPREFQQKQHIRGNELLDFAPLVDMGKIYPLDILDEGI